jgi:hypothetical protein
MGVKPMRDSLNLPANITRRHTSNHIVRGLDNKNRPRKAIADVVCHTPHG